jgi:hypothetical protein
MTRMIIYTKDVMRLTGKSERAAQVLMSRIRKKYDRKPYQAVTVAEFCAFMNLDQQEVLQHLDA